MPLKITQPSMDKSHISRVWPNKFFHYQLEKVHVNEFPQTIFLSGLTYEKKTLTSKYCMLLENRLSEISKRNKNFRTCEYMSVSFCYLIKSTVNAGCFSFQLANPPFVSSFKAYPQILILHDTVAMETVGSVKALENEGWFPSCS